MSLARVAQSYAHGPGGRVVVVDRRGASILDTSSAAGRTFASRPEIASALAGSAASGTRHSNTLHADLLYVAVPVASSGVVHGAVRVTYPTSALAHRIERYWLLLAAIAGVHPRDPSPADVGSSSRGGSAGDPELPGIARGDGNPHGNPLPHPDLVAP